MKFQFSKEYLRFSLLSVLVFAITFAILSVFPGIETIRFSSGKVLIFYFVASLLVISIMEFVLAQSSINGSYVFLLTIFLKVGMFLLIFNKSVFSMENYLMAEKMILILPMFVFLGIESAYLMKKLNT